MNELIIPAAGEQPVTTTATPVPPTTKEASMSNVVPFQFEAHQVRTVTDDTGEIWFVGKDVATVLGYADTVNALKQHCRGVAKHHPIPDSLGRPQEMRVISEPDLFRLVVGSNLPAAERFERWVFEEVLPTIRKTGSYAAPGSQNATPLNDTVRAARAFPPLVRAGRLLGLDKNAAAISANQTIYQMTRVNLMEQLGRTHLEAEKQDTHWHTPTELGKLIGASARGVNLLLAEAGLQLKQGEQWEPTEAGREFSRLYDTGKRHSSGTAITQMKWSRHVLPMLGEHKEAA